MNIIILIAVWIVIGLMHTIISENIKTLITLRVITLAIVVTICFITSNYGNKTVDTNTYELVTINNKSIINDTIYYKTDHSIELVKLLSDNYSIVESDRNEVEVVETKSVFLIFYALDKKYNIFTRS